MRVNKLWLLVCWCICIPTHYNHTRSHCITLQHTATHCNIPWVHRLRLLVSWCICILTRWNALQHIATHYISLHISATFRVCTCQGCSSANRYVYHHTATQCNTLQHNATHCNTLQHIATHCNILQHIATQCNTLQHISEICWCLLVVREQRTCIWKSGWLIHKSALCSRTALLLVRSQNDVKVPRKLIDVMNISISTENQISKSVYRKKERSCQGE